jgi:predicted dehydrogenase
MKQYRAVIVGSGGRSRSHIRPYAMIDNAEVVACCAPTPTRRDILATEFGITTYADARTMIEREQPDIVHLVTWPDTRVELMTLVADLGVPLCTVEKPIATSVTDWRALKQLAERSTTKFAVSHQMRWQQDLQRCQNAMRSGAIGQPLFLDMSSGMNIAGQGTHTLNYGRSLIGDPRVVQVFGSASGWDRSDPGHPAPATSEAYLTFDNGVRGLWTSGWTSPRAGDPGTVWQHIRVAAYATEGRTLYEEFARWQIVTPDGIEEGDVGGMAGHQERNVAAQAGFHRAMFDWLEDSAKEPGTSLDQSLHEWAVVLALYASAVERRAIDLTTFEPSEDLVDSLVTTLQQP